MEQKPYQILGSRFLAGQKNAILADEMGLGKTNQAVCALDILSLGRPTQRTLIVCPAIVRPQWQSKLKQWLLFHNPHPIQQVEHENETIIGQTVIISYTLINTEYILHQLHHIDWDVVIYDEFHYMKNIDAQRTINILGKDGIVTHSEHNWFLSGTPVTAKPADLFPILVTIARKKLRPHTTWLNYIKHFCNAYKDQYGYWKHHGSSNLDELSEILNGVMLRRLAVDEEPDLGKPLMYEVLLELPDNLQEKYEIGCSKINNTDYKSTQERSILAGLKGGVLHEHLGNIQQSHKKIVVFYHHKAISRYMMARNGRKTFKIDGGMSTKKKHTILKEFVESEHATLFAQSQAAGTGLDGIQHGASVCYFAEMPWGPDLRDQNIKRLLRPGQTEKVKAIIPIVQNTVDEDVYRSWFKKEKVIGRILKAKVN